MTKTSPPPKYFKKKSQPIYPLNFLSTAKRHYRLKATRFFSDKSPYPTTLLPHRGVVAATTDSLTLTSHEIFLHTALYSMFNYWTPCL